MHPLFCAWRRGLRPGDRFTLEEDFTSLSHEKEPDRLMTPAGFSWESYQRDPALGSGEDTRLHLSLIPEPYVGNLMQARVVILLLNPGLTPSDYHAQGIPAYRDALLEQLKGEGNAGDYPFLHLDPAYAWQDGFTWWNGKLRAVIKKAAVDWFGKDVIAARRAVARQVAALELVPYHSECFGLSDDLVGRLRSSTLSRDFVRQVLVPKAAAGGCEIVVTRRVRDWGLLAETGDLPGVINYSSPGHARSASLSPGSRGGQAILRAVKAYVETGDPPAAPAPAPWSAPLTPLTAALSD